MRATFENSVNILVKAYLNGSLRFLDCTACAVGNLMSGSGYVFKGAHNDGITEQWLRKIQKEVRCNYEGPNYKPEIATEQIKCTGYSVEQLSDIEFAFESAKHHRELTEDEKQFIGLMSVVDVLAKIHSVSLEQKSVAKAMFVKETTT